MVSLISCRNLYVFLGVNFILFDSFSYVMRFRSSKSVPPFNFMCAGKLMPNDEDLYLKLLKSILDILVTKKEWLVVMN